MFEWDLYIVNSIAGSIYADKFLTAKTSRKTALIAWIFFHFFLTVSVGKRIDAASPSGSVLKVATDILIVLFLLRTLYQKDFSKQFFAAVSFVGGKHIIKYIILVFFLGFDSVCSEIVLDAVEKGWIVSIGGGDRWSKIILLMEETLLSFLYLLLLTVYLSVIAVKFVKKDYRLQRHEYVFLILPSAATLCISITLQMLILSVEKDMPILIFYKVPATLFWVPFICILLLGVNISSVILFQKLIQLNEEERKRSMLENQMAHMQREITEIQDIYADMRGLRHDMRSHLESIAAVVDRTEGKEREELDSYIGQIEETVSRLDFPYQTGNAITDVILHQKKQEAEKQGITFTADFAYPNQKRIDVYDVGIVLNNALENAIEAAGKTDGGKKINVRSYQKGSLFFIEVENSFFGTLMTDKETGLPVSTKADRRLHGLGMENIKRCAGKYKGDIDIAIKETEGGKTFILTVMMYEKTFTPKMP